MNIFIVFQNEHHSEYPVFVSFAENGNFTRNSKRTLTGLMQAACGVFSSKCKIIVGKEKLSQTDKKLFQLKEQTNVS